jgi:hypothetical protein
MRATGGAVKQPACSCARSHRICQIRPSTKPTAIATEISKAITMNKVIGAFLYSPMALSCARKGYRSVFHAAGSVNRAGLDVFCFRKVASCSASQRFFLLLDRYNVRSPKTPRCSL